MALSLLVVIKCGNTKNPIVADDAHATNTDVADTVVYFVTDTVVEYRTEYKYRVVKDTIYVDRVSDPFLLLVQKHFSGVGLYDVWVSGIEPLEVDSVKVYPKTEYRYITKTKTIRDDKGTDLFVTFGLSRFKGLYSPNMGICASVNRKWLYGAEIGLYGNDLYFGAKVGFKINDK